MPFGHTNSWHPSLMWSLVSLGLLLTAVLG